MLKPIFADGSSIQFAAASTSTASAAGVGWIAAAGEWSLALFGIPLSVLLCAAFGAFGALSLMESTSMRRSIASSLTAMMVAAVGTPLALHATTGGQTPVALAPGVAIIAAILLQLILPWLFANGPRLLSELWSRALDKLFGPKPTGGGDAR